MLKNNNQPQPTYISGLQMQGFRFFNLLIVLSVFFFPLTALGQEHEVEVLLVTRNVQIELADQKLVQLEIGSRFQLNQFKALHIPDKGKAYFKLHQRVIEFSQPGSYSQADFKKESNYRIFKGLLSFLTETIQPEAFISSRVVRSSGVSPLNRAQYQDHFNANWKKVVFHRKKGIPLQLNDSEIAATGAWYLQEKQPERSAYLFDFLASEYSEKSIYRSYRNESLQGIALSDINQEVEKALLKSEINQGQYFALLIGVDQYQHAHWEPLANPVNDVRALKEVLLKKYGYSDSNVEVLENPDYQTIIQSFNQLKNKLNADNRLLVYYAGHGFYPEGEDEGYWIPANAGSPVDQSYFLPTSTVLSKIKSMNTRQTLILADACFSGALIRKHRGVSGNNGYFHDLYQKKSRQIITSGGLEPVLDEGKGNHSIFAGNLLTILKEDRSEPISASELAVQLRKSIKNQGADQTPEYGRLRDQDDENGEFFFVQKGQPLPDKQVQEAMQVSKVKVGEASEKRRSSFFPMEVSGGIYGLTQNFQYNFSDSSGDHTNTGNLEGTGIYVGASLIRPSLTWNVYAGLGEYNRMQQCDQSESNSFSNCSKEEDEEDEAAFTSVSGRFFQIGGHIDYIIKQWTSFSIEAGGGLQYQYMMLDQFLEQSSMNVSTLDACLELDGKFHWDAFYIGLFLDGCGKILQDGGEFNSPDDETRSNMRFTSNYKAGLRFGKSWQ